MNAPSNGDSLTAVAVCLGTIVIFLALMAFCFIASDHSWSWALWRAERARKRLLAERVAYFVSLGFHRYDANRRAEQELTAEAIDSVKALDGEPDPDLVRPPSAMSWLG